MTVYTLISLICINGMCGIAAPEAPVPLFDDYTSCLQAAANMQKQIETAMDGANTDAIITSCVGFSKTMTN